ncbi:hypothetical protein BRI6_0336 [plant metagenome]|uniref:Uncharacterized protein n=1 Tax=plant metagenome TaxID=1297885 RepID=A0A484VE59_9ZZZZ
MEAAQQSLVNRIASKEIFDFQPLAQDKSREIRYTRNADFNDEVASEFLNRNLRAADLAAMLAKSEQPALLSPFFY